MHFEHGWRDVVIPTITETQKLSNDFILVDDIVTKEVIELNGLELQAIEDAKIPSSVSNIQSNTLSNSSNIYNNTLSGSSNIRYNTLSNDSILQFTGGSLVSKTLTKLTMEGNNTSIPITATIVFNQNISKTIFNRLDGQSRLQYVNNSNVIVITNVNA